MKWEPARIRGICYAAQNTALGAVRWLDPTRVRMRNQRRFPRWVMGVAIVIPLLMVCVAAVAAALPGENAESSQTIEIETHIESPPTPLTVPSVGPIEAPAPEPENKPSAFYDPLYVFFATAEEVTAYPLASPPGVVVDLKGTAEPLEEALDMIGEDPRVRVVNRRATAAGVRYIIGLTTPIKRVEVFTEGGVAMVYPLL